MRTLKEVLGGYSPKSPDERRFVAKHKVKKHDDVAGNDDKLYKASNIKPVDRESPENHGYNPGSDEAVYEENEVQESAYKDWKNRGKPASEVNQATVKQKKGLLDGSTVKKDPYGSWRQRNFNDRQTTRDIVDRKHPFREDKKQAFAKLLADKPKEPDTNPALNGAEPAKKGDVFKKTLLKQDTEMRQLDPHVQSIVENIMRAKGVIEEATSPNGFPIVVHGTAPAYTGTGGAPHPKEFHVLVRKRTNLQDGDQSHKVMSSHGSLKTADEFAKSFAKDGHDVMIMVPKKG